MLAAMDGTSQSPAEDAGKAGQPPPPGQFFLVRCRGFRCLAYRGPDGKWRDAHSGKELPEVLEVLGEP